MIDWTRIDTLRDEIGEDSLREVVLLFLEEVEAALDALPPEDAAAPLREALHFIKGSALLAGQGRPVPAAPLVAAFRQARAALQARLPGLASA